MKDIKVRLSPTRVPPGSRVQKPTIRITLTGTEARKLMRFMLDSHSNRSMDGVVSDLLRAGRLEGQWKKLAQSYSNQLLEIGATLVKARIITKRSIECDGVSFAVKKKFGPDVRGGYARSDRRVQRKSGRLQKTLLTG